MATDLQLSARKVVSVNPATGEVLRELTCADEAEVRVVVERGRSAQPGWAQIGVRKRIEIVGRFQQELVRQKREVAEAITRESGKPVAEALATEVLVALDSAQFLIDNAYRLLRDEAVPHGNMVAKLKTGRLLREPYGVVGIISPWNYPFSIPAGEALAALVAGNAVVLKPSEFTSLVALKLQALLHASGVPPQVFQVLTGDGTTGAALIHSQIDKLIFTGSVATGKKIATITAARLLPVVLELGGKDPMIVLEDADLDVASSAAVWGAFMNAGQTCLSVERCYVHRSQYEKFLNACVEKTRNLRVGDGFNPETDVGPMIHQRQMHVVEAHVQDAIARGARVLAGGGRLTELGQNFYAPMVLAEVTHEMRIMREETFGPVLPVMVFDSDDQAVQLANDSEYGLAASVWTRDRARGERLARRIRAGTVMVNDVISYFGIREAPHGGVKSSGIGRTHGRLGLEEMVRTKYVDVDRTPGMKKVWWYGYGSSFAKQTSGFLDFQFARNLTSRLCGGLRSTSILRSKKL
jgi:acyl-CoA reductase-like NAD-dependent aldehyde dehydrogenase